MNLELLDPFARTVPDRLDSALTYGVEDATVCCFDRRGTYLAVGYTTGVVVIWDFVTRGIGRVIEAHARAVTALSWARGGRRLLSASHDHRLHYWVLDKPRPKLIRVICFEHPILSAMMLPRNIGRAIALAADGIAYMVDIITPSPGVKAGGESGRGRLPRSLPSVLCMALDRRAGNVCLGTVNGRVVAVRTSDGRVSHSISVVGCSKVTEMDFSRDGKWMLVSSGERVIRMLDRQGTTGKSVRDFQDVVNRTRWQCCRFTGDSEYVAGGSKAEAACSIYIWGIGGHLVTRLEGPQVGLRSLARHPVRPFLAAALDNGKVQLWGNTHTANWTAFAADFEELEENVEYVEKEDEFDVVVDARNPEGQKRKTAAEQQQEEDEEKLTVSIDAIDTVAAWSTASEAEENSAPFYLSTEPGAAAREGWYDLEAQASKGRVAPRAEGWSDEDEWTVHRVGPRLRESSLEANESSLEKKECKGPLHDVPVVVKRNKKKRRRPASVGGSIQSSSSREGDVDRSHGVAPGGDSVGGDRERGRGEREVGKASSVKGRLTLSVLGAAPKTKKKRPRDDGRGEK